MASTSKDKGKRKKTKNSKNEATKGPPQQKHKYTYNRFFCKKFGHVKKNCTKYHVWHVKKVMLISLVGFEVNLALVLRKTWLDLGVSTNINVSMQDCLSDECIFMPSFSLQYWILNWFF